MNRILRHTVGGMLVAAALTAWAAPAKAAFVVDFSPATTGGSYGGAWINQSSNQNFGEQIDFTSAVTITAMDVYTLSHVGNVGTLVTIRLWADQGGIPGALLTSFTETIALKDTDGTAGITNVVRVRANFTNALNLAANTTYWIGMSGTSDELGQVSLNTPGDGTMAWFSGTSYNSQAAIGDMAFRLEGSDINAVPAPPAAILFAIGAVGLGGGRALRRRMMPVAA